MTRFCLAKIFTKLQTGTIIVMMKVMIFVAIVDGKAPIVHIFVDKNGRNVTLNGTYYLDLLNEVVWPTFGSSSTQKGYQWMQDSVFPYCTTEAKSNVKNFSCSVISRRTEIGQPAHSPDLNPLDLYFWAVAQRRGIYLCQTDRCCQAL